MAPSTAWKETVEPGEEELFKGFAQKIVARQGEVARETKGPPLRGFHAKLHVGLAAEFGVLDGLPAHARFGVFSEPRVFPAVVRFSNGLHKPQADRRADPRGIAIKLIGVPGRKLLEGQENAVTQDFLATSHSVTSTVRNVRQFFAFVEAAKNPATLPFKLARHPDVGFRESVRILGAFIRTVVLPKVRSMATEHFSSTAPIKLGPYAVKFTVRPAEGTVPAKEPERPLKDNFLRDELAARLRSGDVLLDFVVQFYVDDQLTPIEDTSVPWKPGNAPFLKVAQLRIPGCDLDDPAVAAVSAVVDQLSFTPWHATEDHRPLGNVMRARRFAYEKSSALRVHRPEPTGLPL